MLIILWIACSDTKKETEPSTEDTNTIDVVEDTATIDTGIEEDTAQECSELSLNVEWQEENLILVLNTFDEMGSYYFGMAQTKYSNPNQWTGEDCHLGFTTENDTFSYCHPARTGITLAYGAAYTDVIEGFSTHFAGPQFSDEVTYIITESISECCWTWGNNPEYYIDLDCILLEE
jgi:hypothetical protein